MAPFESIKLNLPSDVSRHEVLRRVIHICAGYGLSLNDAFASAVSALFERAGVRLVSCDGFLKMSGRDSWMRDQLIALYRSEKV